MLPTPKRDTHAHTLYVLGRYIYHLVLPLHTHFLAPPSMPIPPLLEPTGVASTHLSPSFHPSLTPSATTLPKLEASSAWGQTDPISFTFIVGVNATGDKPLHFLCSEEIAL